MAATEIDNQQEDSSLQRNKHPSPSILPKEQHQDLFEQKTVNKWLRGHRSASRLKGAHGVNSFWKGQRDKRGVSFEPLALLLNAALEGELDLVKECIEKVGTVTYNGAGFGICYQVIQCVTKLLIRGWFITFP